MEKQQLNVSFGDLEDVNKTIDTLFNTIKVLMLYYSSMGTSVLFEFLEQLCLYVWAIYFGLVSSIREADNEK